MRGITPQLIRRVQAQQNPPAISDPELPDEDFVDWYQRGKVPTVRNQVLANRDCGSG